MKHFFKFAEATGMLATFCALLMLLVTGSTRASTVILPGVTHHQDAKQELFILAPPDIEKVLEAMLCIADVGSDELGEPTIPDNCQGCTITHDYQNGYSETYLYFGLGTTTVTWTVTDADGNQASDTQNVTVLDLSPPEFDLNQPDGYNIVMEPGLCRGWVSFDKPTAYDNCGPPVINGPQVAGYYGEGVHRITYEAVDESGNTSYFDVYIVVMDQEAPVFTAIPEPITRAYPDDTFYLTAPQATDNCRSPNVTSDAPRTFPIGTTTVTWTADDYRGNTTTITQLVTITLEECPAFDLAEIQAPQEALLVNSLVEVSIAMRAGGEVSSAVWYWGDGSQSEGTREGDLIKGVHTYSQAGMYTIEVYLENSCGETASITHHEQLVIVDHGAGFLTGGGWFHSPAGAWLNNPMITGRAHFSLKSKYPQAATTPQGTFTFKLPAAGLNFRGTSQDWLVVGDYGGWYSGQGTLNGSSGYRYLVAVADGGSGKMVEDKIRILLWDPAGRVIYDNQQGASLDAGATQSLGGGSVVIHTEKEMPDQGARTAATASDEEAGIKLSAISAYPNPLVAEGLWLAFPEMEKDQEIKAAIYDLKGRLVAEKAFTVGKLAGHYYLAIDHSSWSGGVYLIKISGEQLTKQLKIIK